MYRKIIDENWDDYLRLLEGAIAIPSVKAEAEDEAPFGRAAKKVLDYVLAQAEDYGFKTKIVKNAVGVAQVGDSEEYLGILGHLDVVEANAEEWTFNPYHLAQQDNRLIGRGVLDNKGPILACLFALKLLRDNDIPLKKTVRIMFGTDEESGSSDIPLYLSEEKPPYFGFTPDCKFPVVYGERGVVTVDILTDFPAGLDEIDDLHGRMTRSIVPDYLSLRYRGKVFETWGKQSPSNAPEMGENAITMLASKLSQKLPDGELKDYFTWLTEAFHNKHFGEGAAIQFEDKVSGKLILTPYEIRKEGKQFRLSISIRYPINVNEEEVLSGLESILFDKSQIRVTRSFPSVVREVNCPEVEALSQAYEKVTGLDASPVTTTGSTYARVMPNILAFGPSFPGQKGIAHKEDEYMDIEDLKKVMEIYMESIVRLCNT